MDQGCVFAWWASVGRLRLRVRLIELWAEPRNPAEANQHGALGLDRRDGQRVPENHAIQGLEEEGPHAAQGDGDSCTRTKRV